MTVLSPQGKGTGVVGAQSTKPGGERGSTLEVRSAD